jgi:Family of unknown function (DUF6492)
MSEQKLKVVIPALREHKLFVQYSCNFIVNLPNVLEVEIVTPHMADFEGMRSCKIKVVPDEYYVDVGKKYLEARMPKEHPVSASWYFQQFLKYSIVLKSKDDFVFILDADTLVVDAGIVSVSDFLTARENNQSYYVALEKLLGQKRVMRRSAIVNFMAFERVKLSEMLGEIVKRHGGGAWWDVVLDCVVSNKAVFSEYETYANWMINKGYAKEGRAITFFRRADLLVDMESNSGSEIVSLIEQGRNKGYQAIALEQAHKRTTIRRVGARALFYFGLSVW